MLFYFIFFDLRFKCFVVVGLVACKKSYYSRSQNNCNIRGTDLTLSKLENWPVEKMEFIGDS